MWIKTGKESLSKALSSIQDVVEKRLINPKLSNVLMKTEGDKLELRATNLQIGIKTWVEAEVKEEGEIAINGRKIYEIVRSFSGESVELKTISSTHCEVNDGKSPFKLVYSGPEGFPEFPAPKIEVQDFPSEIMKEFIRKTIFSINQKDSRFIINGVLFKLDNGKAIMVSTDGHRLSLVEKDFDYQGQTKEYILLKNVLAKLQRAEEETLSFGDDERNIFFQFDGKTINVSKVEGRFPNYEVVFPRTINYEVIINREALQDSLRRASIIIEERQGGVRFRVEEGYMEISSQNPDLGEFREKIEADYRGDGFKITFNPRYITEFLSVVDSDLVKMYFDEVGKAVVFEPVHDVVNYKYVVMPIRD